MSTTPKLSADQPRRRSVFAEVGLEGHDEIVDSKIRLERPKPQVRFRCFDSNIEPPAIESVPPSPTAASRGLLSSIPLTHAIFFVLAVMFLTPIIDLRPIISSMSIVPPLAQANPVGEEHKQRKRTSASLVRREDSPTDVCTRWSGQSALVNGTLYYYGGRATTQAGQSSNEWNNDFVTLDLTKTWQIASPSINGLPIPSGPPAVSLGYLWSSNSNLYLYGGEFSDNPVVDPTAFSLWNFDIASSSWNEFPNPTFVTGSPVQRAAEGAGISVPGLGRGYYFGGHLDGYTVEGWLQSVARVYLPTLLEYTMPGFANSALQSNSPAGANGAYRNITADNAGFPERADGILIYVPGYSDSGIILGLAGGTNTTFTQMNIIDVYDIASSTWYKQATSGTTPSIRVNPCAVAASAADGSSTQVYMYGGQNLQPYDNQTQYGDVWILTIPSFTWIKVDTDNQSVPPARAGHTCNVWNAQMVVVGGYVGTELSCDSPGIYVFNLSSLAWQNEYVALDDNDPLNRQESQVKDPNALQGSYGYEVPAAVQSVIGGNALGSATITAPAQAATAGPLATGKPETYTVTNSNGVITTSTSFPGSSASNDSHSGSSTRAGAIAAGVIAGILFIIVIYLCYCAYIYRKQLKLYKNHTALSQRQMLQTGHSPEPPFVVIRSNGKSSREQHSSGTPSGGDRYSSDNRSGGSGHASVNSGRRQDLASNNPYLNVPGGAGFATAASSTEDLMKGQEPSFLGVVLNPRRSLRVVNKD